MKAIKWTVVIIIALLVAGYFTVQYKIKETKKASPEGTISYNYNNFKMQVDYCRPFKKGREIFGGLVPYGDVWRTGANEPTTISFNQNINFGEEKVKAGKYSLWTIPQESQWTVILNKDIPSWGVSFDGKASRNPKKDAVLINVPVRDLDATIEQFTISFEYNVNLSLKWDKTEVMVPISFDAKQ